MSTGGSMRGLGVIAADEPRAVLVARDTLAAGGNAADAAVALYFALSVTYPGSAGLGGGGVCLVRSPDTGPDGEPVVEALDFTSPMPTNPAPPGLEPVGIPANARGMYALHARYGTLPWAQVVLPAEALARFGVRVSRAFSTELAEGIGHVAGEPGSANIFRRPDGSPLREGDRLTQVDLASVLGQIRMRGPGGFYSGALARTIVAGAREAGAYLTVDDLREFIPRWRKPLQGSFGSYAVYFPPEPASGGAIAAALWKTLYEDGRYASADSDARDRVILAATEQALSDEVLERYDGLAATATGPADPAVTGFAVIDGTGRAVACAVSLNGRFGSGRLIRGTGIVAAAAPGGYQDARSAFAPIIVASKYTAGVIAAGAPSGDASAPSAMVSVALRLLRDEQTIQQALGAARAFPGLADKTVFVEQRDTASLRLAGLSDRRRITVPALGRVNLIYCPDGMPRAPETCVFGSDPRGFGYAVDSRPAR